MLLKWAATWNGENKENLLIYTNSVLKMLRGKNELFTIFHLHAFQYLVLSRTYLLTTYIKHVNMTTSYRKTISDKKEEISESWSRINGENTNKGREAVLSDSVSLCKRTFQSFNFVLLLHLSGLSKNLFCFCSQKNHLKKEECWQNNRTTFTNYFRT